MELLRRGNRHRSQESTAANVYSSRSHAVLQVAVEHMERTPGNAAPVRMGKLSLVDLAGSERAAKTKNRGQRMIEGANINRSLLALGNCITALGDRSVRGAYVPFRDSKLTRLLKDSLGGNCRTTMIATCSPTAGYLEETVNTLKYANRAKNIQLKSIPNTCSVAHHISGLQDEVRNLKVGLTGAADCNPELQPWKRFVAKESALPKADAESQLEILRNQIMVNFQDRLELRRSSLNLESLLYQNKAQVVRLTRHVHQWELDNPGAGPLDAPKEIRIARLEIQRLRDCIDDNSILKNTLRERLNACEEQTKSVRSKLQQLTAATDHSSLKLEFRVRLLEVQNIELVEDTLLRARLLQERDALVGRIAETIQVHGRVIRRLQSLLKMQLGETVAATAVAADEELPGLLAKLDCYSEGFFHTSDPI